MRKLVAVREAMENNDWLGSVLGGQSFSAMRALLIGAMGEPLTGPELAIFTQLTGRAEPPAGAVEELWVIAGRRSGKSLGIGALAAYLSACCDYRDVLGPGERGVLPILAASTLQARQVMNFVKGIFTDIPRFAALVESIATDVVSLKNRIDIQIRPASFRTIRGITAIGAIAEECSMWQPEDLGSRNPDREILNALRPAMATTGGALFCIGSPFAKRGEAWRTFQKHFGASGDAAILVANGPTKLFNPTIKQSVIDRAYEADPIVAASEWGGEFRNDLESYVSIELIEACMVTGCYEIAPAEGRNYFAHVDPSGGGQDSFAMAIGHVDDNVGVLDCLIERRGPGLSPEGTIAEFCDILKSYSLNAATDDGYGAGFTQELFRKNGIQYQHSDRSTSDYFAGFLPILNSRRVRLLDNKRLAYQLSSLERRVSRVGAKDSIGHPAGGHDDISCAVAGLMVRMLARVQQNVPCTPPVIIPGLGRSNPFSVGPNPFVVNYGDEASYYWDKRSSGFSIKY